jgi:Tfp pilus assembly protein PilX
MKNTNPQSGVAAMPVIFAMLVLIISLSLLTASLSGNDSASSADVVNSDRALAAAELGAKDALLKIARNKDYSGAYSIAASANGCSAPASGCATVTVDNQSDPKTIYSAGQVGELVRKIVVKAHLDSNGKITSYTWQDN